MQRVSPPPQPQQCKLDVIWAGNLILLSNNILCVGIVCTFKLHEVRPCNLSRSLLQRTNILTLSSLFKKVIVKSQTKTRFYLQKSKENNKNNLHRNTRSVILVSFVTHLLRKQISRYSVPFII